MVRAETVGFEAARGVQLVGTMTPVPGPGAVVMVHGFAGDRTSRGRFPRLASALAARGVASLAFDAAGCGNSDDAVLTLDGLADDVRAAIAYVAARGYTRLALLGHSLGSLVCLRAAPGAAVTMVLTGALTGPMPYDWDALLDERQRAELAATGRVTYPRTDERSRAVVVDGALLRAMTTIDQHTLLAPIECPVMLVLGDGDEEERLLLERARAALPRLPAGSRLEVVAGAPHGFGGAYEEVVRSVTDWVVDHLD
jgi:pimeloyl-ACP methyl ester carboxylesterase